MSGQDRKDGRAPPARPAEGAPADVSHRSGRAAFDERGRTVWEWQVQTGSFDLNADSQRVRALTDIELSLEEPEDPRRPKFKEEGFSPYGAEPVAGNRPSGSNPYSSGTAKRPEAVSYDPHRPRQGVRESSPPPRAPPPTRSGGASPTPSRTPLPAPGAATPPSAARSGSNPYDEAEPVAKRSFNPFNAFKLGAAKKPPR